jgi:hypothetical protein
MSEQFHNLGFLRMATENAIVAHLKNYCQAATVRPAYTTDKIEHPLVSVFARQTREKNPTAYTLARFVDVEIRVVTYAEPEKDGSVELWTARESHFNLLAQVYHGMAQADILDRLNGVGEGRVAFWLCYATTDSQAVENGTYVSTVNVEIGATPQED